MRPQRHLAACSMQWDVNFVCQLLHFTNFSQTQTLTSNLTVSSESQWNVDSNDILSIWKYCQLLTHESNTFLLENAPLKPLGQWGQTTPATAPSPWGLWTTSSTSMPGSTPLTTPNDSLISSCTSAQLCNKVLIGYNGMPQIHPKTAPCPSMIITPI